eukprot:gene20758-34285_t
MGTSTLGDPPSVVGGLPPLPLLRARFDRVDDAIQLTLRPLRERRAKVGVVRLIRAR